MNIMIHACPQRMWYVNDFLIPSMLAQGISEDEITVWNDTEGKGNLFSCMESFKACGERDGGTWHLQDDVIISRDFAEKTRENNDGIVCGFGCRNFGPNMEQKGRVPACFMWYSFQCIRIPNELAGECADWFFADAMHRTEFAPQLVDRKHDDWFFRHFIMERYAKLWVTNIYPNIVDHVDFLIGGTMINKQRRIQNNRAQFFPDLDLVDSLQEKLKNR